MTRKEAIFMVCLILINIFITLKVAVIYSQTQTEIFDPNDWHVADINFDGQVDSQDFAIFAAHYSRPTRMELLVEVELLRKEIEYWRKEAADWKQLNVELLKLLPVSEPNRIGINN